MIIYITNKGEFIMKTNNLKITKKFIALALTSTITLGAMTGCGNKQIVDFNKQFNVAIESNNGYVSIVAIDTYSDYSGDQVQFITEDGLLVLTSTHQTELIKTNEADSVYNYALMLAGNDKEKVIDYNKMQEINIDVSLGGLNKDIFDFHYTYNKAIILSNNSATIAELDSWKDYADDKIQLKFKDGTYILTNTDNIKLINDENAKEDSLYNYALSLVGNNENIVFYDDNSFQKVK